MDLKEYLAMDAAVEDDSLFSKLGNAAKGAISGAKKGWSSGSSEPKSLEKHDKQFHPEGYKEGDTCKLRDTLKEESSPDELQASAGKQEEPVTRVGHRRMTYTAKKCDSQGEFDSLMREAFMLYGDDKFWFDDVSEDDPFFKKMEELNPSLMKAWKDYWAKEEPDLKWGKKATKSGNEDVTFTHAPELGGSEESPWAEAERKYGPQMESGAEELKRFLRVIDRGDTPIGVAAGNFLKKLGLENNPKNLHFAQTLAHEYIDEESDAEDVEAQFKRYYGALLDTGNKPTNTTTSNAVSQSVGSPLPLAKASPRILDYLDELDAMRDEGFDDNDSDIAELKDGLRKTLGLQDTPQVRKFIDNLESYAESEDLGDYLNDIYPKMASGQSVESKANTQGNASQKTPAQTYIHSVNRQNVPLTRFAKMDRNGLNEFSKSLWEEARVRGGFGSEFIPHPESRPHKIDSFLNENGIQYPDNLGNRKIVAILGECQHRSNARSLADEIDRSSDELKDDENTRYKAIRLRGSDGRKTWVGITVEPDERISPSDEERY